MFVGERFKNERERLGLTQPELAAMVDATKQAVFKWETGRTFPNANVLSVFAEVGADVAYILTGQRQSHGIGESAVHQAVLDAVDLLSLDKKIDAQQLAKAVVKLCEKGIKPAKTEARQVFNDKVIQASYVEGDLNQPGLTIKVGRKKK